MNTCNAYYGNIYSCENDEFYKLQSQFEDLNINTITSDNIIELLKEVTDNNLHEKIIQLNVNNNISSSKNVEKQKNDFEFEYSAPYSLSEVNNRLNKQPTSTRDSSFDDLKIEVEKLKNEIKSLKQNQMICEHHLPIILGTPFINAIYPFTNINIKEFSATYEDRDISYTFITDPISRDINALINMKQKHVDSLQLELFRKIKLISEHIVVDIFADHPSAFWNHKNQIVTLPYEGDFSENDIPTKYRPCQMNTELVPWHENMFKMNFQLINGTGLKLGFLTLLVLMTFIIFLKSFKKPALCIIILCSLYLGL
ncbi:hypothetical protein H5410_004783 [Solanum commersonii]|uniref:Uncharacterized protein n=1 Tax=Solanum commersonii TaxID=4109 RepID=A0A9J6A4S8_SOLCO|nr:hypothetical protein H5410_004783 [Solanum commersonii]